MSRLGGLGAFDAIDQLADVVLKIEKWQMTSKFDLRRQIGVPLTCMDSKNDAWRRPFEPNDAWTPHHSVVGGVHVGVNRGVSVKGGYGS